ncbi:hypothetical protein AB0D94_02140 [Streptomyces sp. NPDC048255]|uniref:hypothetical protein n=1 Tax=Streptomyces sp. NPDC048255 TaxID=3154713 RepID=UPI0033CDB02D
MTFRSVTAAACIPLFQRPAVHRPLTGLWRSLDWYVQETMGATSVHGARYIAGDRWNGPGMACLRIRAARLAKGEVEAVALRLAAISVNCGWPAVVSGAGVPVAGVPVHFAGLWAAVAQRIGTARFAAAPLLAIVNHTAAEAPGDAANAVLTWSGTDSLSRIDLLLATAARIDSINAAVLLKSHQLEHAGARPLTAIRALERIIRIQSLVQEVLGTRLTAMGGATCPAIGLVAAQTLAADAPRAPDCLPPRLVTPLQQAIESLLGLRVLENGLVARPQARRYLGREQAQALVPLDEVGYQVRDLARSHAQVARVYERAVAEIRRSNTLYRQLIDAVVRPAAMPARAGSSPRVDI